MLRERIYSRLRIYFDTGYIATDTYPAPSFLSKQEKSEEYFLLNLNITEERLSKVLHLFFLETKGETVPDDNYLKGLGGWLILIGLVIILAPVRNIFIVFPVYTELFSNGSWAQITTPSTESYHLLWAPVIIGEIAINSGIILAWLLIGFLFFSKNRIFPLCFISLLIFSAVFILVDALAINLILPNEAIFDSNTKNEFLQFLFSITIWGLYFRKSKRVAATFVQ